MGFLAPLYIAGALAIGLPILFHLIRRTPHSRQEFSSLMFLTPSPPRLTRRSRLTNILLLILRATAIVILALAFARPFFSSEAESQTDKARGRRVALLVDTSASMRQEDLWAQATREAERVLGEVSPNDEVGLYFFDERVRPGMTFREWNELEPSKRAPVLRARLAEAKPSWGATHLGDALATAADLVAEAEGTVVPTPGAGKDAPAKPPADKTTRQLVLISDLQQGGHVETLQGHQWPASVLLQVRPVGAKGPTNAALQVIKPSPDDAERDAAKLRVRVTNQPDSKREQFSLAWANDKGPIAGIEPLKVYVPPGRGQVARVAWPSPDRKADRLIVQGDDQDFDNTLYLVPPTAESVRVLFVGADGPDDVEGLAYYLHRAAADTPQRKVEWVMRRPADPLTEADLTGTRLAVVTGAVSEASANALKRLAESGGDVLWVLKDASPAAAAPLTGPLGSTVTIAEAPARDFALVSQLDTTHPLLAPFADARFGDFTKVHFWHHRRVTLGDAGSAPPSAVRVLARFDDNDPFLLERTLGKGRLILATSGWQPADSQLALSTKFVPLIDGLLRRPDAATVTAAATVGEPIALPTSGQRTLLDPDGKSLDVGQSASFGGADRPGVYHLTADGRDTAIAVNLAPDESRTAPLPVEELERWGAKLGTVPTSEELITRERRLRLAELENRQKLWRWLIVGVLGLLAAETFLAGRAARRAATTAAATLTETTAPAPAEATT